VAIVPLDRLPLSVANIGETLTKQGGDALQKVGEGALQNAAREELEKLVEEVQDSEVDTGYKQIERGQMERLIRNTEGVK
jgi:hypothetical protein